MDYRRNYRAAAVSFADLVSRLPAGGWDGPGAGDWNLRELIGHTVSSALRQVPPVLTATGGVVTLRAPEDYWAFARSAPPELHAAATAASSTDAGRPARGSATTRPPGSASSPDRPPRRWPPPTTTTW